MAEENLVLNNKNHRVFLYRDRIVLMVVPSKFDVFKISIY